MNKLDECINKKNVIQGSGSTLDDQLLIYEEDRTALAAVVNNLKNVDVKVPKRMELFMVWRQNQTSKGTRWKVP